MSDPDAVRLREIRSALVLAGAEHTTDVALASLIASIGDRRTDLLVVGVNAAAQGTEALAVIARVRHADPALPVIVMVSDSSEAFAIAALRAGVTDYLRHPAESAALADTARRVLEARRPAPNTRAPLPVAAAAGNDPLIGSTSVMRNVCEYLDRLAQSDATVLITGETGTGKELAAHRLHDHSRRRRGHFVPVNCAAIPDALLENELFGHEAGAFTGASRCREGLLAQANGGTIFLDEVADLGLAAQAKILRAIETRQVYRLGGRHPTPVDVRIVSATNHDLERAVEDQRFRKDLYFRLNVARVHLPPLRERRSDIPSLIDYYLHALDRRSTRSIADVEPETIQALVEYDWPGNVRELKNIVEGLLAVTLPGRVRFEDLPPLFRAQLERSGRVPDVERTRMMDALFAARWNKSRAAEMLHWSRMTLYRKMAKYSVFTTPRGAPAARKSRSG